VTLEGGSRVLDSSGRRDGRKDGVAIEDRNLAHGTSLARFGAPGACASAFMLPGVSANGVRRPPRPRIELVSQGASATEATAIVAGLERFLAEHAPRPTAAGPPQSAWQRAALEDGIAARQVSGAAWGHAPR
jgi:hypothetical protein